MRQLEKLERHKNIFCEYSLENFLSYFFGISCRDVESAPCRDVGSKFMDVASALGGFSGPTWVVNGPNTWDAAGGCVTGRAMTDGLAAFGDWLVQLQSGKGLVTSSGSTPGLVARTSADPIPYEK